MKNFNYVGHPSRIFFGSGTIDRLEEEAQNLSMRRVLVITTPGQAEQGEEIAGKLGGIEPLVYPHAAMHTPVEVTETAELFLKEHSIDGLIAIGGGSTTGLAKALAFRTDLPQIIVPTTYAGSEVTPILGETKDSVKQTFSDASVLPETVIYDVDLTLGLPVAMTVASGMNAIAHAVEALYSRDANPILDFMALDGIRALAGALRTIVNDPTDLEARSNALYGAWLCGVCLGSAGMALHHKLCHTLGGSFGLPHAETHSAVLPHAMAYNAPSAPEADARIASVLGSPTAAAGLHQLALDIGAPTSLASYGFAAGDAERAADLALAKPYWNPRALERTKLIVLLENAMAGLAPETIDA